MAESKIPGGAYLSADKNTWHDANGNVIPNPFEKSTEEIAVTDVTDAKNSDVEPQAQDLQPAETVQPRQRGRGNRNQGDSKPAEALGADTNTQDGDAGEKPQLTEAG